VTLLFNPIRWFTHHITGVVKPPLPSPPGGRHAAIAYSETTDWVPPRRRSLNEAAHKQRVVAGGMVASR
jgi:hypothetical protein